jgi:SNF family Na+-dependent transporter
MLIRKSSGGNTSLQYASIQSVTDNILSNTLSTVLSNCVISVDSEIPELN